MMLLPSDSHEKCYLIALWEIKDSAFVELQSKGTQILTILFIISLLQALDTLWKYNNELLLYRFQINYFEVFA